MLCCWDVIQHDGTVKTKEMQYCVILHTHSSCYISMILQGGEKVSRECTVKGLTPDLLLHQLYAGTIKSRCSGMESSAIVCLVTGN